MVKESFAGAERPGEISLSADRVDKDAVARTARLLGDTWSLLIICELLEGVKRFGEIQEGLGKNQPRGVNPQTLSGRLKMLEHCGIVTRQAYAEIPPRVEYQLTAKGYGVSEIVVALEAFGRKHMAEELEPALGECPGGGGGEFPSDSEN